LGKRSSSSLRRTSVSPGKSRWPFVRIQAWPSYSSNWARRCISPGGFQRSDSRRGAAGLQGRVSPKILVHPFTRVNTKDNTPAIIHLSLVPGIKSKSSSRPRGRGGKHVHGGHAQPLGWNRGVKNRVVEWVKQAGSNPCPPVVVGVGVGGTFEEVALTAKKALSSPPGAEEPGSPTRGDGGGASHPGQQPGNRAPGAGGEDYRAGCERGVDSLPYRQLSHGRKPELPRPPAPRSRNLKEVAE